MNLFMIIASALRFLRSKNISHMDLKPQNMLLSSQNDPVLKLAGIRSIINAISTYLSILQIVIYHS